MSDYRLTDTDAVVRTGDQAHIPNDPANRDWQEYQQWLADGGVPDPYVPPDPLPLLPTSGEVANDRITTGIVDANQTYNGAPAASDADRIARLEETVKAMCQGQLLIGVEALKWR